MPKIFVIVGKSQTWQDMTSTGDKKIFLVQSSSKTNVSITLVLYFEWSRQFKSLWLFNPSAFDHLIYVMSFNLGD